MFTFEWLGLPSESGIQRVLHRSVTSSRNLQAVTTVTITPINKVMKRTPVVGKVPADEPASNLSDFE